jgi:hypothetical protein
MSEIKKTAYQTTIALGTGLMALSILGLLGWT